MRRPNDKLQITVRPIRQVHVCTYRYARVTCRISPRANLTRASNGTFAAPSQRDPKICTFHISRCRDIFRESETSLESVIFGINESSRTHEFVEIVNYSYYYIKKLLSTCVENKILTRRTISV